MHLTNCGNCSAFKIARDVAMKGKPMQTRRRMARDEAPAKKPSALMKGILRLSGDELTNALSLLRQCLGGATAEDDGEGFGSPHEREVEEMDDDRNRSTAMDDAAQLAFDTHTGAGKVRRGASLAVGFGGGPKIDHAKVLAELDRAK